MRQIAGTQSSSVQSGKRHPGQFKKGVSGNPGGRSAKLKAVEDAARTHTTLAIATLARICRSKKAPESAQAYAAVALLDRGWGKPKQSIEATMSFDLAEMMRLGRERLVTIEQDADAPG